MPRNQIKMNVRHLGRLILVALFLRVTIAVPQASFGVGPSDSHNVSANAAGTAQTQPTESRVIVADQQSGSDIGAKIGAANLALGSGKGEIRVGKSGELSEPIVLSQNHDLVCVDNQVTLTLSNPQAKITQESNTRISGCTFASTQTVSGADGFFARNLKHPGRGRHFHGRRIPHPVQHGLEFHHQEHAPSFDYRKRRIADSYRLIRSRSDYFTADHRFYRARWQFRHSPDWD